jgi:hypothetical protein
MPDVVALLDGPAGDYTGGWFEREHLLIIEGGRVPYEWVGDKGVIIVWLSLFTEEVVEAEFGPVRPAQ